MKRRQPGWELMNTIRALSTHSWLNSPEENQRLADAKAELQRRRS